MLRSAELAAAVHCQRLAVQAAEPARCGTYSSEAGAWNTALQTLFVFIPQARKSDIANPHWFYSSRKKMEHTLSLIHI